MDIKNFGNVPVQNKQSKPRGAVIQFQESGYSDKTEGWSAWRQI